MKHALQILTMTVLLAMAAPALAADPACATPGACRLVEEVTLPTAEGGARALKIGKTVPWLAENNLMLFSGDAVVISLPDTGDDVLPTTLVSTGKAARDGKLDDGQIRIVFEPSGRGMMMTVDSKYGRPLHYMAIMVTPDGKPHKTSVCVLRPGIAVFESWPHPIIQLAIAHFKPVAEGQNFCR